MGYVSKIVVGETNLVGSSLYGVCSTSASTAVKIVDLPDLDSISTGVTIHVLFVNSNTALNPSLSVGTTGTYPIYRYGTTPPGQKGVDTWAANSVVSFTYDGNAWRINQSSDVRTWTIVDLIYPVGSIYMSVEGTNPGVLFGGNWSQLKGRFLIGKNDTYSTSGGSATHTLTVDELPSHSHAIAHTHSMKHTHTLTAAKEHVIDHLHSYSPGTGSQTSTSPTLTVEAENKTITTNSISSQNTGASSAANSGLTGNGAAFSIMPPYLPVYMWKRIS